MPPTLRPTLWRGCLASCSIRRALPSLVFLYVVPANLAAGSPPAAVVGMGRPSGRGGAPHPTADYCAADPQKQARRGTESAPRLVCFFWEGLAGPVQKSLLLVFTCTPSQNVLIPGVQNVLARKAGGRRGPTPGGVSQRQTLGVRSWKPRRAAQKRMPIWQLG